MRPIPNPKQTVPVYAEEVIDRFLTAAPGLPLALCGGGVMSECANFIVKPDRLESRKPFDVLAGAYPPTNDYRLVFAAYGKLYAIAGWGEDIKMYRLGKTYGKRTGLEGASVLTYLDEPDLDVPGCEYRYSLRSAYGDSLLLRRHSSKTDPPRSLSVILDAGRDELRRLGLRQPPSPEVEENSWIHEPNVDIAGGGERFCYRYIGVEYVAKRDGLVMRSSGITKPEKISMSRSIETHPQYHYSEFGYLFRFTLRYLMMGASPNTVLQALQNEGITHMRIWMSDFAGEYDHISYEYVPFSEAELKAMATRGFEGTHNQLKTAAHKKNSELDVNPYNMQMLFELDVSEMLDAPDVDSDRDKTSGFWSNNESGEWECGVFKVKGRMATNARLRFSIRVSDKEPHEFEIQPESSIVDEEDPAAMFGLVPMENAMLYCGGRLWGARGGNLLYSCPAGVAWHEQRDPINELRLNMGDIVSMETLDSDLYVFCLGGIARLASGSPESVPSIISLAGANSAITFAAEGYGIAVAIHGSLYFLDKSTRAFSSDFQGFDIGRLLGELAKDIRRFAVHRGSLYILAGNRLFRKELPQNCGISEIVCSRREPIDIASDGVTLAVLYKHVDGNISLLGYEWAVLGTEGRLDCWATFCKNATSGWVEHWDTGIYARLPGGSEVVGTEDICDGLLYPDSVCKMPEGRADSPWEYRAAAGRDGEKRPIGKTIGIRAFIENASQGENASSVFKVAIGSASQDEARVGFNPNSRSGPPFLATEHGMPLIRELGHV